MKEIALFGGSFNPPHLGHQMMLLYLLLVYDFDEIWINPVGKHYFDKDRFLIPPKHRINMAKIAFEKLSEKVRVKTFDIDNNFSKTYDTINFLKRENYKNKIKITLILGEDNYNSRNKWYKFDELEKEVNIIYLGRSNIQSNLKLPFKFPNISSSEIRKNLSDSILMLDKEVFQYIKANKLYI